MKLVMSDCSFTDYLIHLDELDFETASQFYPEYSLSDRLKLIRCLTAILSLIR